MDEFKQIVIIAAVLLILSLALVIALRINNTASDVVTSQEQQLIQVMAVMEESKFAVYDNKEVSGTQTLAAVQGYRGAEYAILVKTKAGGFKNYNCQIDDSGASDIYTNDESIQKTGRIEISEHLNTEVAQNNNYKPAQAKTDENYINPRGVFKSYILIDSNGQIIGI